MIPKIIQIQRQFFPKTPYLCLPISEPASAEPEAVKQLIMGYHRDFEIAFVGLKPGFQYNYDISDRFFEVFQQQDFRHCKARVKLTLDNGFLFLKFEIGGTMEVTCDRCDRNLPLDLWDEFHITVKMVDDAERSNGPEEDPDVYYIGRGDSHIDVANWIYEFINLRSPCRSPAVMKRWMGLFVTPQRGIYSRNWSRKTRKKKDNPIWKGLEKFKNLDKLI